tara:strand:+ start:1642 stop:1848 length:207 start_codon:yes stop_codon:yes gene_type:complete
MTDEKPALGAMPEAIWRAKRIDELVGAIGRHHVSGRNIAFATDNEVHALHWVAELGRHAEWFLERRDV